MNTSNQNNKKNKFSGWFSTFLWIGLAVFLRWQVIEPRWIPSGSMLPTLEVKDRILIEKISPKLPSHTERILKRGSVVVFKPPKELIEAGYDKNSALIKRIVGLPGDQIEVHMGQLIRNGTPVSESWRKQPMKYEMSKITIPKDSLWVLGDNRNNSLDSHLWGALPEKNVLGRAIWRYWPLKRFGPIRFPTHENV